DSNEPSFILLRSLDDEIFTFLSFFWSFGVSKNFKASKLVLKGNFKSPQVYHIKKILVQKNQPVLYWLIDNEGNSPERSFVREELMVIKDAQLPPQWVL